MKKIISLIIVFGLMLLLVSCANNSEKETDAQSTKQVSTAEDSKKADIDLTQLSTKMAYSQLYNMIASPDDYIGKTVKMRGKYSVYDGENRKYYVCEIMDETACCTQGLEFILANGEEYPEYNPDSPITIEITGTFNTYLEDNQPYVQLENTKISK